MERFLLVGLGGFLGSGLRFLISGWVQRLAPTSVFPWGTLAVNVLGCFVLGGVYGLAESRGVFGPAARLFLFIGLLGGFTTFSTFAWETLALGRDAEIGQFLANIGLQVTTGLAAVWLGHSLTRVV